MEQMELFPKHPTPLIINGIKYVPAVQTDEYIVISKEQFKQKLELSKRWSDEYGNQDDQLVGLLFK